MEQLIEQHALTIEHWVKADAGQRGCELRAAAMVLRSLARRAAIMQTCVRDLAQLATAHNEGRADYQARIQAIVDRAENLATAKTIGPYRVQVYNQDPQQLAAPEAGGVTHDQSSWQARSITLASLSRGLWVEIFHQESGELVSGPFSPDEAIPAFIV